MASTESDHLPMTRGLAFYRGVETGRSKLGTGLGGFRLRWV